MTLDEKFHTLADKIYPNDLDAAYKLYKWLRRTWERQPKSFPDVEAFLTHAESEIAARAELAKARQEYQEKKATEIEGGS